MSLKPEKRVDLIFEIEKDGWRYHKSKGGHDHYKHPTKKGKVTVPKQVKEVSGWESKMIRRQAGLK